VVEETKLAELCSGHPCLCYDIHLLLRTYASVPKLSLSARGWPRPDFPQGGSGARDYHPTPWEKSCHSSITTASFILLDLANLTHQDYLDTDSVSDTAHPSGTGSGPCVFTFLYTPRTPLALLPTLRDEQQEEHRQLYIARSLLAPPLTSN